MLTNKLFITIGKETFRLPITKIVEIILIKNQDDSYFLNCFNINYFYVQLYCKLSHCGALCDIIKHIYPNKADYVTNCIYSNVNSIDINIVDLIIRYNKKVNSIIQWVKENENYVQTLIQEIQEGKYK